MSKENPTNAPKHADLFFLYMDYPHKKGMGFKRPGRYVPASERSNHKDALTYMEWKAIVRAYLDFLIESLMDGRTISTMFGDFELVRYRPTGNRLDFKKLWKKVRDKKGFNDHDELVRMCELPNAPRDNHGMANGWNITIAWYRSYYGIRSGLKIWYFNFSRKVFGNICNHFKQHPNDIYKLKMSKWRL